MGAVHRIARLEANNATPTTSGKFLAGLRGIKTILGESLRPGAALD